MIYGHVYKKVLVDVNYMIVEFGDLLLRYSSKATSFYSLVTCTSTRTRVKSTRFRVNIHSALMYVCV